MKKYDIAISFAGEDREVAISIANILTSKHVSVFYDEFEKANLWGKDLYEHLNGVYKDNSKYCLMIISKAYSRKLWTNHERKAAQARAFQENREYILPLRLDDSEISGVLETTGFIDYRHENAESVANLILQKLWDDLENHKVFEPVKKQLEALYMRTMLVCEMGFTPLSADTSGKVSFALNLHKEGKKMYEKARSDLAIISPTIDGLVLNQILTVMDAFDNVLNRVLFLMNLHNTNLSKFYFIGEIPVEDFHTLHQFLSKLRIFDDYEKENKRYFKPEEIIKQWESAEKDYERYCSKPEKAEKKDGMVKLLYDYKTAKALNSESMSVGDQAQFFRDGG